MAAREWGTGLGAVQNAIEFYMRLREQRYDRERLAASDARADRQLRFNEEEALRDNQRADEELARRRIEFQATNFGGNEIPQTDAAQWRKLGYGSALEDEQTLSAYQKDGMPILQEDPSSPTGTVPSPMKTIQQASARVPTGRTLIRQPESERMRVAYYNALAADRRQDANIASRERISSQTLALRQRQIDAMLQRADSQMALQRYGIDTRDATARMQLAQLIAMNSALVQDREWDNMFSGGPMSLLRFMTPDQGIQMPPNRPLYYEPPQAGSAGTPSGGGYQDLGPAF